MRINRIILGVGIGAVILLVLLVGGDVSTTSAEVYVTRMVVRDATNDNPLSNTLIDIYDDSDDTLALSRITGVNGDLAFALVTGRTYRFNIDRTDYRPRSFVLNIPSNTHTSMVIPLWPNVTLPPAPRANLWLSEAIAFSTTPTSVVAGSNTTLSTLRIVNDGGTASGAFDVKIYLSSDSTITTSDTWLKTVSFASIAADSGFTPADAVRTVTIPAGTAACSGCYIGVIVDPTNVVAESNETDNALKSTPLTVTAPVSTYTISGALGTTDARVGSACLSDELECDNVGTCSVSGSNYTCSGISPGDYIRITPTKSGGTFSPISRAHSNITADITTQNFSFATNVSPTVTTPTSMAITTTTATLGANVTSLGVPAAISARGTCWGTTTAPTTNCLAEGSLTAGVFTQARTGFSPNTTYYYRGYATNSTGTAYSSTGSFTTAAGYTLTVAKSPTAGGTITATGINCGTDCSESYNSDTSVTLTATPASGYSFVSLTGGGCLSTAPTCTLTMDASKTVTAIFSDLPDLIVSNVPVLNKTSVSKAGSLAARTVTFPWHLKNQGAVASGAFHYGYYLSSNAIISHTDTLLISSSQSQASVAANTDLNKGTVSVIIPTSTSVGTYYVGVLLDDYSPDEVNEFNENNNYWGGILTVTN